MGCSLFAGEAEEGRIDKVLQDAAHGTLRRSTITWTICRRWNRADAVSAARAILKRTLNHYASFDAGRGCPFQCSFCTIINVQGRKSRRRSPDDVEQLIRQHCKHGFNWFFITDDNFARNKDWEADLRPDHRAARARRPQHQARHPGRHAVPQDSELHREGGARRREPGLHRAGEHQSGQPDGGQEAAEQDHRIPQDAAGLEEGAASSPMPATSSASRPTRRNRSARTSKSSRRSCRSTFWSSSA